VFGLETDQLSELYVEGPPTTIGDLFRVFFETKWDDSKAYQIRDFADEFKIEIRLARYYLMKEVDHGDLMLVKYDGSTWYIKRNGNYERFKAFSWIGVKIL
jgi:hypothetical protein